LFFGGRQVGIDLLEQFSLPSIVCLRFPIPSSYFPCGFPSLHVSATQIRSDPVSAKKIKKKIASRLTTEGVCGRARTRRAGRATSQPRGCSLARSPHAPTAQHPSKLWPNLIQYKKKENSNGSARSDRWLALVASRTWRLVCLAIRSSAPADQHARSQLGFLVGRPIWPGTARSGPSGAIARPQTISVVERPASPSSWLVWSLQCSEITGKKELELIGANQTVISVCLFWSSEVFSSCSMLA
jgi:hypothetical protein